MRPFSLFISAFLLLSIFACEYRDDYKSVPETVDGYKPIYFDTASSIETLVYSDTAIKEGGSGNNYTYKQFHLIEVYRSGCHVVDRSDPQHPKNIAFIHIPFNFGLSLNDSILEAKTYMGLIRLNIAHLPAVSVVYWDKMVFSHLGIPPFPGLPDKAIFDDNKEFFECIIPENGRVVGWEPAVLNKPKCFQ